MTRVVSLLQCLLTDGCGPATTRSVWSALERADLGPDPLNQVPVTTLVQVTGRDLMMFKRMRAVRTEAETLLDVMRSRGIGAISWLDPAYPVRLAHLRGVTAPTLLFVQGNPSLMLERGVAVGGSREATGIVLTATESAIRIILERQRTIVSGGARGVDLTAHLAAIRNRGNTIVVIPQGLLTYSPPRAIATAVADHRAVIVSEFPPLLPWSTYAALHRNRSVVGIAETLIVAKSGLSGGTKSAASDAFRMGVPVGAFAFARDAGPFPGNSELIAGGAIPIPVTIQGEVDPEALVALIDRAGRPASPRAQTSFI